MMAKIKRILAAVMVLCMCLSAMPLQALAADGTTNEHEFKFEDGWRKEITTTTTVSNSEGNPTVTVEIKDTNSQTGIPGAVGTHVEREEHSEKTTLTHKDQEGNVVEEEVTHSKEETSTTTTTVTENSTRIETVEDGKEMSKEEVTLPEGGVTVDVPTTEGESNSESFTAPAGTETITGDEPEGEDDTEYDYTKTTVEEQGKVTVTTNTVEVKENIVEKIVDENGNVIQGTDLDYVHSQVKPSNGTQEGTVDNDLFIWVYRGNRVDLPEKGEKIELEKGFEYKYLGAGNTSQFLPAFLFSERQPGYEEEEPVYVDAEGNEYFLGPWSANYAANPDGYTKTNGFTELYINGETIILEEAIPTVFSVPQQFILVDGATGELITTYCADINTDAVGGFNYNIENLEDANYYDDDQAAMIRTIAKNGYWGTESGEGSLDAMKEMMRNAKDADDKPLFTEEEIAQLTDGVALTATQLAIWNFSNAANSDMVFVNSHYSKNGNDVTGELPTSYAGSLLNGGPETTPDDKEDSIALLYKLYDYMISMDPTPVAAEGENPTTADTIINDKNFIKDMSVTVIEMDKAHENNKDYDRTNDAYVTKVTFSLVVSPAEDNDGDDLMAYLMDGDGNVIASGRVAGDGTEGDYLPKDDAGNYYFDNVTMVEGDQEFQLNLSGIQNLDKGVYLYTSEVEIGEDNEETSSQTMVGVASGEHSVDVTMDIKFEVGVDDGVMITERVWHREHDPIVDEDDDDDDYTPPTPPQNPDDPGEPETVEEPVTTVYTVTVQEGDAIVIEDEEVPLAAAPETGDNSFFFIAVIMMAAMALYVVNFGKKNEYETF